MCEFFLYMYIHLYINDKSTTVPVCDQNINLNHDYDKEFFPSGTLFETLFSPKTK